MTPLRSLLESQGFTRIALKSLKTKHYKFSAKINGVWGEFILDTGASTSCIGLESTHHFGLNTKESNIKAAGAGAINMPTRISKSNQLTIGKFISPRVDFVIFDLSHVNEALKQVNEIPIHGILGADILKNQRAVIDYGRNCFYLKQ